MSAVVRVLRSAARSLRRSPGVSVVSILTLGVGIALSTVVFSIVYGVFIKGLPFREPNEIVVVQQENRLTGAGQLPIFVRDWPVYRDQQRTLTSLAAFVTGGANILFDGHAERFEGAWITANTMATLGVRPLLGRNLGPRDDRPGAAPQALLSHSLWHDRFAGNPSVIGRAIRVNGELVTVIGIMPPNFRFPDNSALWLNLQINPGVTASNAGTTVTVWGRLQKGVTMAGANADMTAIAQRLKVEHRDSNAQLDAHVVGWIDAELGPLRQFMYTMLGAALCVLLIACANVANLLLERAIGRTKQIGVRIALGASRANIAVNFLAESLLLALVASALALAAAQLGITSFNQAIASTNPPFYIDIAMHGPVFVFGMSVALVASGLSAVLPVRQTGRININVVLMDESRGSSGFRAGRMSRLLVVGGVALSCGLLVAAGLMAKSITRLGHIDLGFATAEILTTQIDVTSTDADRLRHLTTSIDDRLRASGGIVSVALSSTLPGVGMRATPVIAEGATSTPSGATPTAVVQSVTSGFFATFRMRRLQGRLLTDDDRAGTVPVVLVSEKLAHRLYGSGNAMGQRIRLADSDSSPVWRTIVGVVSDSYSGVPQRPFAERVYLSLAQVPASSFMVSIHSALPTAVLRRTLQDVVTAVSSDLALLNTQSMADAIARPLWKVRVFGSMFVALGILALFLGAVGLYAMMAATVTRRTRELGIRMALGAHTRDILAMVIRQGLAHVGIGILLGLGLALAAGQGLALVLFDVQARDPMVFGTVVSVLVGTGVAACLVPALRATRIDPARSLSHE